MKKVISISGFIGAGKDSVADILTTQHGFRRESFASVLKDAVSSIFGWPRDLLEGRTAASRQWREEVDEWWAQRLRIPNLSPRWILQQWGTEVCRLGFHNDIWVASLENRLRQSESDVVITDARFANELDTIKRIGGITACVVRGETPFWYNNALATNMGMSTAMHDQTEVHESEWGWVGYEFSRNIDNNGSLDDLRQQVLKLI
jgi:hypothetical protein